MQETNQTLNQPKQIPKELVLANAVHEIRTPVQTIIGTLDLLSDTQLTAEQMEYVRQIRFGSDVLLSLVNDLLDFSKLKSKKMQIENIPYDVKNLVENVVHLISIEAYNKGIEIVSDIDYTIPNLIMGDPNRVQQILMNLLKNAVKFTNEGYIHLELASNSKTLLFRVTDSGIGVEESKRSMIFESFYQGDANISRKYGGSGLGLQICKGLVQNMNGQIGFNPNPYGGSVFWFTLPLVAATEPDTKIYDLPVPATTRILIVDNSQMALNSLKNQLNFIGLQYIQTTTSAKEALLMMNYAQQIGNPYNIVFIDMIMPVMDGWHLASDIKNTPSLSNTKLYMLVPEGQMGKEAKLKLLNWFSGYLYKPVRIDKLDSLLIETNGSITSLDFMDKPSPAVTPEMSKGIKILVVEDHPVNRRIIVEFLKKFGADILEATNGLEALNIYKMNSDIQIVFMDIQMPVMDGLEATRLLRSDNFTGVIIACTANNDSDTFPEYIKTGMNDILVKPFKRENIQNILEKWQTVITLPSANQIAFMDSNMMVKKDIWDVEDFEDTIGRDMDLGNQVLNDYKEQTRCFLNASYDLLENEDYEELHRIAHTIKGSSASISANNMAYLASEMSTASKEKDGEKLLLALNNLEEAFEIFILSTEHWQHQEKQD